MELAEAREWVDRWRGRGEWLSTAGQAAVILDDRITELEVENEKFRDLVADAGEIMTLRDRAVEEQHNRAEKLEARLDIFLCDAVPDKKWDKVFKRSAADYLRHRAAHFIKNYGDPVRGYRMNQLANEIEKTEAQKKELFGLVKEAIAFPEEARDIMRRNNIKLDDLNNIYQKLAFTFYSTMAEHSSKASQVIEEYKEIKQPALRAPMDKEV